MNNKICHQQRKVRSRGSVRWIAMALIAAVVLFASVPANADIGASLVTYIADTSDTSSYSFPSATYSNNVLYIAFTSTACGSGQDCGLGVDMVAAVASVSGAGLTFTEIGPAGGLVFSTDGRRIQAWRALATSGATTGAVTVTMQTGTISASMGASMIEFTGTKTSGTNGADAVVQWPSVDGGSTSSLTVTMQAFANSNNRPVAFFSHRYGSGDPLYTDHDTAEGYTELHDQDHGSVMMLDMTEWHATSANTTPSASWSAAHDTGGFALEIAAGSTTTTRTVAIHPSGTAAPVGYDATYTSMAAMEAAEDGDLVALDRLLRVEIVNSDGDWTTADTAVIFDGWNTNRSAGQYVEIEVMDGARNPYTDGKWSTSHYRLSSSSSTIALLIDNDAAAGSYFEADFIGLQVENTAGGLAVQVRDNAYHKTIKFKACHFRGTAAFEVIELMDNGTAEVWFINSILENSYPTNDDEILRATSAWQTAGTAAAYFYNCTVVGGGLEGLDVSAGTIVVKNCAVFNNGTNDIYQSGATVDYVASDASVGTNWVDISPAAEADGWNAAVTDYVNGDYRLKDSNSVLYQAGLSQSSDPYVPTEDIAGNARPTGSNPVSIGAFESIGGGGGGNQVPTVDAGSNQTITLPASADLSDASASDSDGPSSLTYTWSKQSGPGTVTFSPNNTSLNPTASFSVDGTYILQLSVYDGAGTSDDTVTITVNPSGGGVGTPITAGDVAGYSCNMKITIDNTKVAFTSPENFPVLISLTDDSLKTSGCASVTDPDGDDIIFTNSSLTLQLYHEIEKYDETTGELVAWVLVPSLSGSADTDIYMYFGNSNVTSPTESPTDVWDSNYVAVWHLKEDPSGTAPQMKDSTSNGNHGTSAGSMTSGDQVTGIIGGALDFDGSNDEIRFSDAMLGDRTAWSITAWIQTTGDGEGIYSEGNTSTGDYLMIRKDNYKLDFYLENPPYYPDFAGGTLGSNFHHIAIVQTSKSSRASFVDGGSKTSNSQDAGTINYTTSSIGLVRTDWTCCEFSGIIDEVRISSVARSDEWIVTEYNNQSDPSTFYSVEKNCTGATAPPIAEFTCSIPLTIDSSKVSGTTDLINFPVLISLTDIGLKTTSACGYVQSSSGDDIIFSDASQTTVLDHEIEEYDSTSGKLVAWVRVPTLYATADTTIYLHFGHSGTCGATENPTGVWDSNYVGVWHLKETPGTDAYAYDSTSNDHDLTIRAEVTSGDQVDGKIGGAIDFDDAGSTDRLRMGDDPSFGGMSGLTVETWVKLSPVTPQAGDNSESYYMSYKSHTIDPWFSWQFMAPDWDPGFYLEVRTDAGAGHGSVHGNTAASANTWYHVVGVYESDQPLKLYVNGADDSKWPATPTGNILNTDSYFNLGMNMDGILDEFRVSNVARTADWIKTSFNNQSDPSSFYSVGASSCFFGGFSCDRKITIDSSKVAGSSDLTNFPVLIKIQNDCNIKTAANGGSVQDDNGLDIMFTDSDGVTQLDHEIEAYDGTTGDLTAWVKVPTLPYNSDKDIYLYYGKSGLTCDPSNPNGVWDSDYVGVWHLKESSGSGSYVKNSKQDAYHGNPSGSNFIANAKIAGGRQVNQPVEFDNGGDLLDGDTAFTLSFWGNPNYASDSAWNSAEEHMFFSDSVWGLRWGYSGWVQADVHLTSGTKYFNDSDPLPREQWHYLVLNFDGSRLRWYKDGDEVGVSSDYTGQALGSNSVACLGYCYGGGGVSSIDEFRYSRSARSAGWIQTEYNNQNDPDSFYSMGEDSCGGSYGFNFQYCKKITVDHTQVDSDLTDFPLLINLANDDDLRTVANGGRIENSQGYDIVFRSPGCGNLDHEVEKYDGSTGDLVAWVRTPTLSSSVDTEIYMYYGANVNCSTENPSGVWDSNYKGVWHMKDLGTPATGDSTSYSNDGTKKAAGEPVEVDENIGKAQDFGNDGTADEYINISSVANDVDVNQGTYELWLRREFADSGGGGGCSNVAIDGSADYGTVDQGSSITISHTTSGSDRLMLVGVSLVNDGMEYVTGVTYNSTALTKVGSINNSDDARIEIWSLVAPDIGTHDVVITFNETLNTQAVGGVMTFTCVDQSTPLGTFSSAISTSSSASVDVSSATGELVFGVVAAETPQGFTEGAGQTEHWYQVLGSGRTEGAGSTEAGAATVTTSWTLGHSDHWAIGGVSIKPVAGGGASPTMSIMRVDTDAENSITFTYEQDIEKFRFRHEAGNTDIKVERASSEIPINTWTHAAMTWDKSAGEFKAYINGSQVGSTLTGLGTWVGSATYGNLGRKYDDTQYYEGSLDEARISNVARSADWIQTGYINQSDPGNFYTVGSCFEQTTEVTEGWEESVQ